MRAASFLSLLGAFVGIAVAQFPPPPANTTYYYLRTCVQNDQTDKGAYEGKYVVAYHTGAGLSDATLNDEALPAHRAWFNGTHLNFFEPTANNTLYFGIGFQERNGYDLWDFITINGGQSNTDGFSVDDETNRLIYAGGSQFYGFLDCDWAHGVQQLFAQKRPATIPSSCAKVDIILEKAPTVSS